MGPDEESSSSLVVDDRVESNVSSGSESGDEKVAIVSELANRIGRAKRHMVSGCRK